MGDARRGRVRGRDGGGLALSRTGLFEAGAANTIWTLGFVAGGAGLLVKVAGQSADPGARFGVSVVGVMFVVMGLAAGVAAVLQYRRMQHRPQRRVRAEPPPETPQARERQLHRLRSNGTLSRAEFDQLKPDVGGTGEADRIGRIHDLATQHEAGKLNQREFDTAKRDILRGATGAP